jgi:hypothetical protein
VGETKTADFNLFKENSSMIQIHSKEAKAESADKMNLNKRDMSKTHQEMLYGEIWIHIQELEIKTVSLK